MRSKWIGEMGLGTRGWTSFAMNFPTSASVELSIWPFGRAAVRNVDSMRILWIIWSPLGRDWVKVQEDLLPTFGHFVVSMLKRTPTLSPAAVFIPTEVQADIGWFAKLGWIALIVMLHSFAPALCVIAEVLAFGISSLFSLVFMCRFIWCWWHIAYSFVWLYAPILCTLSGYL
jgi:hypothetical protein